MKFTIMHCVGMSLCQIQVFYIHIPLYGQQVPCSILVQEGELFVAVYYHQMRARGVETQIADGVSCEWLHYAETVHVFIHAMEVPQSHVVIEATGGHAMSLGLDCDAGNSLGVAIEPGLRFDRDAQLKPGGLFGNLLPIPELTARCFSLMWGLLLF